MAKRNNDSEIKKPTTQEEARDEYRRREVNRCVNDFLYFAKSLTPKAFYNETPDFHHEVIKLMMDRSKEQICIQAPRGFAKSTLNVRFILHHILFDPGNKVVIIQSKTQPEAINRLDAIKNILEYSQYFKDVFGYCGQAAPQTKTWTEKKIKTGLAGFEFSIKAIGTGMPARGVLETGEDLSDTRITLFLLDDPDDEENTLTKDQMLKNYDKFAGSKEGLDPRTGRVICIGTPVRQGCIVDRLYGATGWESKKYQAYWKENGEIKLLWGERRSYEWLQAKMAEYEYQGRISKFYSEYMCEIVGEEDQLFKEEYIQYYEGHVDAKQDGGVLHITKINDREVNLSKPVNIFIGIDPASSTKQTADFSVTMPIAYDEDGNIYVLPYFRKRVTPTAHAEQIIETIKHLKPTRGYVETVNYQEMLRVYLRQRLEEEGMYLPGLEKKYNPRTEKSVRLESLHPYFYNRKVYMTPNMQDLLDELLMYPRSRNDDLLDGLYYATRGLLKPDHTIQDIEQDEWKYFLRNSNKQKSWLVA
jgi:predicted phage terminase large subunit-like protein